MQAPIPKAKTSVMLVTVTETPACLMVRPILSGMDMAAKVGSEERLYQHSMITNMSSMPIPVIYTHDIVNTDHVIIYL